LKMSITTPKRGGHFKREFSLFELMICRSIRRPIDRGPLVSLDPVFKEPRPVAGFSI
jgi:hypothetical protein